MSSSILDAVENKTPEAGASGLSARALIGWMTREEAVRFLSEDCVFSTPLRTRDAEDLWETRREIAESLRIEAVPPSPKLPLTAADLKVARQFRSKHPDADSVVDFVRLNPLDLVVHQLWISTTIADRYRDKVTADKWASTALLDPLTLSRLKWRREGNALLVNLPHFEYFLAGPWQPQGKMWVSEADPFVTVALHADRALLLKGYHRTFACAESLLAGGIAEASAGVLFGASNSLTLMGSDANDMLRMMESLRPPRMADFFDERLFVPVTLRRRRYRMRIDYEVAEISEEERQAAEAPMPYAEALRLAWASRESVGDSRKSVGLRNVNGMFEVAMRYHHAGRYDRAEEILRRVIALAPDFSDAFNNLGVSLVAQGRSAEAIPFYEKAIALRPDAADFYSNIGIACADDGRFDDAVGYYERSLSLRPDNVEGLINLSCALVEKRRRASAVKYAQRALELDPDNADVLNNLAYALLQQGNVEEAKPYLERAVTINPRHVQGLTNLGNVLKIQGKFEEALSLYSRSLEIDPEYVQAHGNRAECKTYCPGDPDLEALEALAARNLPGEKAMTIHFALGKALDDCKEYKRSFEQWRKGNALKRSRINFDGRGLDEGLQQIKTLFSREMIERFQGAGDPSEIPVFVLGMPRSGSTLVEQILSSHPQVFAAGEIKDLDKAERVAFADIDKSLRFPGFASSLDAGILRRIGEEYVANVQARADGQIRVIDKLPGNFAKIGLIRMALPNAKIIHTVRDPVDTCISCYSKLFNIGGPEYTYDLTELGQHYRGYWELMNYWRSILPAGTILDVVYEEVVGDIEFQARRLIEYCGLEWDDRCLDFHKNQRKVRTASVAQVRKPLYRSSVQRWRRYGEAELAPLLEALGDLVPEAVPPESPSEETPLVS